MQLRTRLVVDEIGPDGECYPRAVVEAALKLYAVAVQEGRAFGTAKAAAELTPTMNLHDVSHVIRRVWIDDEGRVQVEIEILPTKPGAKLNEAIEKYGPQRVIARVGSFGSMDERRRCNEMIVVQFAWDVDTEMD